MAQRLEKAVQINLESVCVETAQSILLVDQAVANALSVLYSIESFWKSFSPLLYRTLPFVAEPPIQLQRTSKVVFFLSGFLWESWDSIRQAVNEFTFPEPVDGASTGTLSVVVYCAASDSSHEGLRPDFSPSNTTAYG